MTETVQTPGRDAPPRMASYEDERRTFTLDVSGPFNAVVDILDAWAEDAPDALAVVSVDAEGAIAARTTTAELVAESRRAANALLGLGVAKGDRVFVMLPPVPSWYAAMLGAMRIGAVPMPAPNMSTPRDIAYRINTSGAVAAIASAEGAAKLEAVDEPLPSLTHRIADGAAPAGWHQLGALIAEAGDAPTPTAPTTADDPLLIFFTSGTVAYPKMVEHRQSYALGHIRTARFWHDLRPGDVHWTVSDTGWAKAAWGGLFGQWRERASVVQANLARPTAEAVLEILQRVGVTSFCAPPTLYRMLVQADLGGVDFSRLRHCTSAGEPLNPEVIRVWAEATDGLTIYDGYGQSESTLLVGNYRAVPVRPGSMGKPAPGYEIAIVDDDGERCPPGEVGNLAVSTRPFPVGLFRGYGGDTGEGESPFHGDWYFTGDKAFTDEDGYFWFEGRADDVITSAAYRIGPFEVESALIEHAAVAECAVVGKDDPERTQIVCAFVVLAEGWQGSDELVEQLRTHAKQVTAPYKCPREIYFVPELPKTISGKIRRGELRARLAAGDS